MCKKNVGKNIFGVCCGMLNHSSVYECECGG